MISQLRSYHCIFTFVVLATILLSTTSFTDAQTCNGILISYAAGTGVRLPPNVTNPKKQPYRFESTLTVLNNGLDELKSWKVFVGFQHDEFLVSASGAVLADGTTLPAAVGNGSLFAGYPMTDLKTAVETAGDLTQMQAQINLVGTVFGVAPPNVPLPSSINLANDGFICGKATAQDMNGTNVCCTRDPKFKTNITTDEKFLPRQDGDLTIMYDVIRSYDSNYWAEVLIRPLSMLLIVFSVSKSMDPSKSVSRFQMQVYKMPPMLNRSELSPPQNWKISGSLNPDYKCGPPIRVSPTANPDPTGLPLNKTVMASWQVVCNITTAKGTSSKCCVSFSAYYNESVIPCKTCACGCAENVGNTCSTTAPAMWLPSDALLVPFDNRSAKAKAWADLKHLPRPNPMPCSDNCDWFAAVQMDKATAGFEKMYSFNGSAIEINGVNNTIIMQGLEGLNYLVGETDGADPRRDPRVPGKQQSVMSFTKKTTPGISVVHGDGFPTKVFFNGEECSLPSVFPTSSASKKEFSFANLILLPLLLAVFMW
ncbi:unnamed protein product [Vicia faba]|uniref:COBRA C-terminal domain-containing protein n=1 Tax=Vicia faba TaxID=3906 RepID=A0AAV1AJN2_VICFA|nr:unnamed protein product [Vicia faba]